MSHDKKQTHVVVNGKIVEKSVKIKLRDELGTSAKVNELLRTVAQK